MIGYVRDRMQEGIPFEEVDESPSFMIVGMGKRVPSPVSPKGNM